MLSVARAEHAAGAEVPRCRLETLPALLDRLPARLAALDIDGRRIFDYESVYFDTRELHALPPPRAGQTQALQGPDAAATATPATRCSRSSSRVARGQTVKERLPYDFQRRGELTREGRAFLDAVVGRAYGSHGADAWPGLTTAYRRATLVDLERRSRLTIDVNLGWSDRWSSHRADHLALIESKSLSGRGPVDALLRLMGVRPVRMSKYCLGVASFVVRRAAGSLLFRQLFSTPVSRQKTGTRLRIPCPGNEAGKHRFSELLPNVAGH